ncbi:MAG TPA: hypothetical protein VED40_11190 [Azospirillaceae bacterium]|nr:hypothetical protein [Azospirillaceae bacterium]
MPSNIAPGIAPAAPVTAGSFRVLSPGELPTNALTAFPIAIAPSAPGTAVDVTVGELPRTLPARLTPEEIAKLGLTAVTLPAPIELGAVSSGELIRPLHIDLSAVSWMSPMPELRGGPSSEAFEIAGEGELIPCLVGMEGFPASGVDLWGIGAGAPEIEPSSEGVTIAWGAVPGWVVMFTGVIDIPLTA